MSISSNRERKRGALLGLAIGDALGAAVEFQARGSFEPVTGYRGDGPHELAAGEWTDDTSMALAMADSLACFGMDLADQGRRYVRWWREGTYSVNGRCFDIGTATFAALERIEEGATVGGSTADNTSGNGSIMRLAPLAIYFSRLYPSRVADLAAYAGQSSTTTHASEKCVSACRYLGVVLAALIEGVDRDEVLSPSWPALKELQATAPLHPDILAVAKGSYRTKTADEIQGSGYVVDSLEAALWSFTRATSFEEAVLTAVNLGDDTDTTGAVCGQLAGAFFGANNIPPTWLAGLAKRDWIEVAVEHLLSLRYKRYS